MEVLIFQAQFSISLQVQIVECNYKSHDIVGFEFKGAIYNIFSLLDVVDAHYMYAKTNWRRHILRRI